MAQTQQAQSGKAYVKGRITLQKEYWSKSGRRPNVRETRKLPIQLLHATRNGTLLRGSVPIIPNKRYRIMSFSENIKKWGHPPGKTADQVQSYDSP